MFFNIYRYSFKTILKDKMTMFWLVLYPIILATLFYFAFTNILSDESFEKINVAVVENESMPDTLKLAIDESEMFNISFVDANMAKSMLSEAKIDAYIICGDDIELVFNKEGMNESITKVFFDNYTQMSDVIKSIITANPAIMQSNYFSSIDLTASNIEDIPIGNSTDVVVIYFYSMMAMTCLLSATLGIYAVMQIQANQSDVAARINVAPVHKLKSFLILVCAAMTFHIISVILTLIYIIGILKVDFGGSLGLILLICFVGSFMGMAFGSFISAVIRKKEGVKMAIALTVNLFGCFLAGMMNTDMKYVVQSKFPLVSYINPANLITDGLYSLYYYDTLTRYFVNLGILGIYGVVFCILTYLVLRRQKYASI